MKSTKTKLALSSSTEKELTIVLEDENTKYFTLAGMITPYYMQDK